jgi:hypothetical protein
MAAFACSPPGVSVATVARDKRESSPKANTVFFDDALAAFTSAAGETPVTQTLDLCGSARLRLVFGSPELAAQLGPVFSHLTVDNDSGPADFVIYAWDSASTGVAMPPPPWSTDEYGPGGEVRQPGWPRTLRVRFNLHSGVLSMVDAARRRAMWWTSNAAQLPDYERGAPFLHLFHWWQLLLADIEQACVVHSAAVGNRDGGVLLAGRGGSGKSSTALACLAAGLRYAADDHCLLCNIDSQPRVASLYATGKLNDEMLRRYPVFAPAVVNPQRPPEEKALLFLADAFDDRLASAFPLRGIILPRVVPDAAESRLMPAMPSAALQALAPSTIFLFRPVGNEGAALLARLAQATRRLPAFHLELGARADAKRVPELVAELLARLESGTPNV